MKFKKDEIRFLTTDGKNPKFDGYHFKVNTNDGEPIYMFITKDETGKWMSTEYTSGMSLGITSNTRKDCANKVKQYISTINIEVIKKAIPKVLNKTPTD